MIACFVTLFRIAFFFFFVFLSVVLFSSRNFCFWAVFGFSFFCDYVLKTRSLVLGWNLGKCMHRSFRKKEIVSFWKENVRTSKYKKIYIGFGRFVYFHRYLSTPTDRVFM